jgi:hypothetical protein
MIRDKLFVQQIQWLFKCHTGLRQQAGTDHDDAFVDQSAALTPVFGGPIAGTVGPVLGTQGIGPNHVRASAYSISSRVKSLNPCWR